MTLHIVVVFKVTTDEQGSAYPKKITIPFLPTPALPGSGSSRTKRERVLSQPNWAPLEDSAK